MIVPVNYYGLHLSKIFTGLIMKRFILMSLLALSTPVFALPEPARIAAPSDSAANELKMLDALIEVTQQNLEAQKQIKQLVAEYQKAQKKYLKNTEDKEQLIRTIKIAYKAHEAIRNNYLTQAFTPEFMSELSMFAQIASKRGIPKP